MLPLHRLLPTRLSTLRLFAPGIFDIACREIKLIDPLKVKCKVMRRGCEELAVDGPELFNKPVFVSCSLGVGSFTSP